MRLLFAFFTVALVATAVALPASAQDCAEGRVSTPETAGRCCWPAQTWSDERGRCAGPPTCPEGLVAEGDRCVLPVLAYPAMPSAYAGPSSTSDLATDVPPAPDLATTYTPSASLAPRTRLAWPVTPEFEQALVDPVLVRGTDEGLLLGGLLTFAAGYLGSIMFALIDEAAQNCGRFTGFGFTANGCASWGFAFIPVAGGLMSGFTGMNGGRTNVAIGFGAHLPLAMVQILGLVLTSIAAFGYTENAVSAATLESASISIAPYATDHEGGVWLDARF